MRVISRTPVDVVYRFRDDRRHAARAELAAKPRDDAEAAGVVTAFGDLDGS
jgi:hypothetical protein